ncbi:hypothetical protein ACPXCX_45405, partial [Streptomyces sp. DT225]
CHDLLEPRADQVNVGIAEAPQRGPQVAQDFVSALKVELSSEKVSEVRVRLNWLAQGVPTAGRRGGIT